MHLQKTSLQSVPLPVGPELAYRVRMALQFDEVALCETSENIKIIILNAP